MSPLKDVLDQAELMMPVSSQEARDQFVIQALRQISDALRTTNNGLTGLSADMRDARERLISIEANRMDERVAENRVALQEVAVRVAVLEAEKNERGGMKKVGDWTARFIPWIVALAGAAAAFVGFTDGKHS